MIELIGNKVRLKTIHQDDVGTLWKLIYSEKNPEWKKWDAPYYPLAFNSLDDFKLKFNFENKLAIWIDGKFEGTVSYYWEHKASNWLEVGLTIYSSQYWSQGYGTEALKLWIDYLFNILPLVRVGLTTWSGNLAMMYCAKNLGMKQEACLRKCRLWEGKYFDSIRYGILKEEWNEHVHKAS